METAEYRLKDLFLCMEYMSSEVPGKQLDLTRCLKFRMCRLLLNPKLNCSKIETIASALIADKQLSSIVNTNFTFRMFLIVEWNFQSSPIFKFGWTLPYSKTHYSDVWYCMNDATWTKCLDCCFSGFSIRQL